MRLVVTVVLAACGRADFDPLPDGAGCGPFATPPASSLVDNFSSGSLVPNWVDHGSCIQETGGELVAPVPANMNAFCLAYTATAYHLTCDAITVHVPETTSPILRVQTVIYLDGSASTDLLLEAGGFQLGGVDLGAYDAVADAWWRLRESAGRLSFDTSPDGTSWIPRGTIADPMSFDNLTIVLGAGAYQPRASPGQARFHCFNTPPPCN